MGVIKIIQGADTHSTGKLLVAVVSICFENKKWDLLNENLVLLTKRRGQIKQVSIAKVVLFGKTLTCICCK